MKTPDGFRTPFDREAAQPPGPGPTAADLIELEADAGDTLVWRPTDAELARMRELAAAARAGGEVPGGDV